MDGMQQQQQQQQAMMGQQPMGMGQQPGMMMQPGMAQQQQQQQQQPGMVQQPGDMGGMASSTMFDQYAVDLPESKRERGMEGLRGGGSEAMARVGGWVAGGRAGACRGGGAQHAACFVPRSRGGN
jgi:hypothetical protein